MLLGPENKTHTVPVSVLIGGFCGKRPHFALYLFQGSAVAGSGLTRLDLGLAWGSPVPPAALRQGAMIGMSEFTGAELEEEVPVYSV